MDKHSCLRYLQPTLNIKHRLQFDFFHFLAYDKKATGKKKSLEIIQPTTDIFIFGLHLGGEKGRILGA